jgi:glucose/arabinose dehydrogenase
MSPLRFVLLLLTSVTLASGCQGGPDASAAADLTPAASPVSPAPVTTPAREAASTAPTGASARPPAAGALGPLQRYALPAGERLSFDAVIVERLDAGSYGYLRVVRDDGSASVWIATLRPSVDVGARVHVTAFGHTRDFDSRRLKRRFDDLYFAAVRRS